MNKFSKIGFEYLFMFIAFTQLAVPLLSICCVLMVQLIYPFTKPIKDIIDTTISLSLVIGNFLLFLFIVYRLRHHFRYRKFSRHYFGRDILLYVLILAICFPMWNYFISDLFPLPDFDSDVISKISNTSYFGSLAICIVGPFVEEFVLRGSLERMILKGNKGRPWLAILISAAVFGVMHVNPAQISYSFLSGILYGWIYFKLKSVWPSVILHSINNSISMILIQFFPNDDRLIDIFNGNTMIMCITLSFTLILFIYSLIKIEVRV